jgi:23S rRNA pseudoU1915 N3-methylase RlmH
MRQACPCLPQARSAHACSTQDNLEAENAAKFLGQHQTVEVLGLSKQVSGSSGPNWVPSQKCTLFGEVSDFTFTHRFFQIIIFDNFCH